MTEMPMLTLFAHTLPQLQVNKGYSTRMLKRVPARGETTSSKDKSASDMKRIEEPLPWLRRCRWCKLKGFPCRGSGPLINSLTWRRPHVRRMEASSCVHHNTSLPMTSNVLGAIWVDRLHLSRWEAWWIVSQLRRICPTNKKIRGKQTRRKFSVVNFKDWSPWKGKISWICTGRWKELLARRAIKEAAL